VSVARWAQVNRGKQIVAAYAAGEAVEQIGKRLGVSTDDILRVVAEETASGTAASPTPRDPGRGWCWSGSGLVMARICGTDSMSRSIDGRMASARSPSALVGYAGFQLSLDPRVSRTLKGA
jgi:hypothetical protein